MRSLPTLILCSLFATACDKGPKAVPKNNTQSTANTQTVLPLDDAFFQSNEHTGNNALLLSTSFTGASADGIEADMLLQYKVRPQVLPAVTPATELVVSINKNGRAEELYRAKVDTDSMSGELEITVEPSSDGASLVVGLDNLNANIVTGIPAYSTIALPTVLEIKDSSLDRIAGMYAELVEGSYNTEIVGDRREHRFAVRVYADFDSPAAQSAEECNNSFTAADLDPDLDPGLEANAQAKLLKPVIGLDINADDNFKALENGSLDPDPESPVSVSFSKESLGVYLVMDVSSSVVESGVAHHMLDAVARSVISLARFSDFNYRIFASNVYELGSLRDINFDDQKGSGTALYYSVDTALNDIESYAPAEQNKVIIAISDGQDLASRNFYPAFKSHEQVREYVAQRIVNVREGQNSFYDSQLKAYFIELPGSSGGVGENNGLHELATLSNSQRFVVSDKQGLKDSLQTITNDVGGTYDLVYSSQQTPDDTTVDLKVRAGNCSFNVNIAH